MSDDADERRVDLEISVVLDKSKVLNPFMKKLTRDRVVPTISASVSCETLGRWAGMITEIVES